MRILCLTARLPFPPNRGDRLRAYHFLRHLSPHHELTLLSFIADEREREHLPALAPLFADIHVVRLSPPRSALNVLTNLWRDEPLQALYYRSAQMRALVDEQVGTGRFDAAYIHLFRMVPFLAGHRDLYRIVDLTDVISKEVALSLPYRGRLWRLIYGLERPRIARFERTAAQICDEAWLISDQDRRLLQADVPAANVRVVPNGVDLAQFRPLGAPADPDTLIFVGHLGVFHNIDAVRFLARQILPLVRRERPACRLRVVGAGMSPEVEALGGLPGVELVGFVDDLNQSLNAAALFAAPLRFAAGVQNKVLEAMAAGRPVITTSLISQGVGAQPERDLLVADDAAACARQILRLLADSDLQTRLGASGRAFVEAHFSWQFVVERMAEIAAQR